MHPYTRGAWQTEVLCAASRNQHTLARQRKALSYQPAQVLLRAKKCDKCHSSGGDCGPVTTDLRSRARWRTEVHDWPIGSLLPLA